MKTKSKTRIAKPSPRQPGKGGRVLSIKVRHDNTGWEISCPIGLWAVCGPNKKNVFREAMHYFALYWDGGEYDHLFTPAGEGRGK